MELQQGSLDPATAGKGVTHPTLRLGIHVRWRAVLLAGLFAGTVFLALELITAFAFGAGTPFGPAHVTLHGLIGEEGVPYRLDPAQVIAGIFLHYLLSVVMTIPLAILIHPWRDLSLVLAVGGLLGFVLFFINVQILNFVLPVCTEAHSIFMLIDYVVFGLAAAGGYKRLQRL